MITTYYPLELTITAIDLAAETPHGSRESNLRFNSDGQQILVAAGRRDDLFGLAQNMFGARHGAWTNVGEYRWSYPIQTANGSSPIQLTQREKQIMTHLAETPGISSEELANRMAEEQAHIHSAVRFLYESGFLVIENGRYTTRSK